VYDASFSLDGTMLASSGQDNTIRLWDTTAGKELKILRGHADYVWYRDFSPNNKWLASSARDKTIKLWEVETGREAFSINNFEVINWKTFFSLDSKLLALTDGYKLKIWDITTAKELKVLPFPFKSNENPPNEMITLFFRASESDITLVSRKWKKIGGTPKNPINASIYDFWDAQSGKLLSSIDVGPSDSIEQDVEKKSTVVNVWDINSGKKIKSVQQIDSDFMRVQRIFYSQDKKSLLTYRTGWIASKPYNQIDFWDLIVGKIQKTYKIEDFPINPIALSPNAKLVVGNDGKATQAFNLDTKMPIFSLSNNKGQVNCIAINLDGKTFLSGDSNANITLRDISTGKEVSRLLTGSSEIRSVRRLAFAPDGKTLAIAGEGESLSFWDITTGKKLRDVDMFRIGGKGIGAISFSSDGKRLLIVNAANFHATVDVASGKADKLEQGRGGGSPAVVSSDHKFLVAYSWEGILEAWEIDSGKKLWGEPKPANSGQAGISPATATALAISSDDKLVATANRGNSLKLLEATTGKELSSLSGHSSWANALVFSKDGKTLFSGGTDDTIKLWNTATGKELFSVSTIGVNALALSSDGKMLVSGHTDGTVKVWDVR
jgi:WD40 repeat protein